MGDLSEITVVHSVELTATTLRAQEGKKDNVDVHASEEYANDLSVIVALGDRLLSVDRCNKTRKGEFGTEFGFDGRRGGGGKVTELVGCTNDESSEGTR